MVGCQSYIDRREVNILSNLDNRIDRLALVYLKEHYDIKTMSPKEFLEKFNEISKEIFDAYQGTR